MASRSGSRSSRGEIADILEGLAVRTQQSPGVTPPPIVDGAPPGSPVTTGPTPPHPGPTTAAIALGPAPGPLPDSPEELLKIISHLQSLPQALAAMGMLGEPYGRDITEDMTQVSPETFWPIVNSMAVGGNAATTSNFAVYIVPLRRALARQFGAKTPDVAMMMDLAVLSYWRAIQAESLVVSYLAAALEKPHFIKHVDVLERVKESATRQFLRLLDALRMATGKTATLHPDRDAAAILRFPANLIDGTEAERRRAASAG